MKSIFRVVLTAFLLLPSLADSRAGDGVPWNQLLDRYELVCKKCLELNALRDSGQYVSSRQLMDVMDELESLRSQLRVASDKMPASARRRFKAIRKMYQEGNITDTRQEPPPHLDAGSLTPKPVISYTSPSMVTHMPAASPPPAPRPRWTIYATSVVIPDLSCGGMVSCTGLRIGGYCAFRSNFSYHDTAYDALRDGSSGDSRIWASGLTATDCLFITAGPVVPATRQLSLFGGAGYGYRRLCWEDTDGLWMRISDTSSSGLCTELGAMWNFSHISLSLSWIALPPTHSAASISIGYRF